MTTGDSDDDVTVDDLREAHPGASGPGDSGAFLAALDEGWRAGDILTHATRYAGLIHQQNGTPVAVAPWLVSIGSPPRVGRGR